MRYYISFGLYKIRWIGSDILYALVGRSLTAANLLSIPAQVIFCYKMLTAWDRVQGKPNVCIFFDDSHFYYQYGGISKWRL
jgi:hypothetical protein